MTKSSYNMPEKKINPADKKKKTDNPARILRAQDWSGTPASSLAAFPFTPFIGAKSGGEAEDENQRTSLVISQLMKAQSQAAQALVQERLDRKEAEKVAMEKGLILGRQEGEAQALEQFKRIVKQEMDQVWRHLSTEKNRVFAEIEEQAFTLLSFALRRVFGDLAESWPEAVVPLIQEALSALGTNTNVTVKVNPSNLEVAFEHRSFWQHLYNEGDIRCIADERVPKGGCVVVADSTSASIDLESLGKRLSEAIQEVAADRIKRASLALSVSTLREPKVPDSILSTGVIEESP